MHDDMQPLDTNLPPSNEGPDNVDHEGAMAKADLFKLANYSVKLFKKIDDNDQLESWVQAKITKAADYIASVYHYLEYEMKFSEFGSKLENSEMYTESQKQELKNKLMEAKEKVKELKKLQADKIAGKKTVKVKESWDDEDPDVAKAEKELKKKGVKLPKVKGVDPDKDISKLAKKSKKDDDLDESWDDDDDDVKKADAELKKMGKKPIKAHSKVDPDKDISKLAKKSKKDDDLDESADKKAKKDYDGDGKIESEKDEVWGSRMKAASKAKKVDEESKPSAGLSKAQKSATVKKAKAGGDIGKKGKGFKDVAAKAAKQYGSKEKGEKVAAAAMWKNIKRENVQPVNEGKNKNVHSPIIRELMDFCKSRTIEQDIYRIIVGGAPDYALSDRAIQEILDVAGHEARFHHLNMREDTYEIVDLVINNLQEEYGSEEMDEVSDEENDVISAPQPQPEPNPEENDVISAPMNESTELSRMKTLLTRLNG